MTDEQMGSGIVPRAARLRRTLPVVVPIVVALALATFFIWPLFQSAWFQTHDMLAYPVRAVEYVAGWRSGTFWPRWAPDLYGGFGCPFFNFYAPGLFILSGIFITFGASAVLALKLALVLLTATGVACTYGAILGETHRRDAATVAAFVFMFMAYHITQVYVRGDLAEYGAGCLCPAAIWAYRALGRVRVERLAIVAVAAALLQAATLIVHTLTGQWLTQFLIVIAGATAWSCWRRGDRGRVLAIATAYVCACGLTAIYSVPALLERPLVMIERMTEGGLTIENNTIDLRWTTTRGFFYAGRPALYLPFVAVLLLLLRPRRSLPVVVWTLACVALVLTMLHGSIPLWRYLPFGHYIQFPWRLLGFVALFAAFGWGFAWSELVQLPRPLAWGLAVVVCVAVAADGWTGRPTYAPMTAAEVPATPLEIAHGMHSTVISDEYLPRWKARRLEPETRFILATSHASVETPLRSRGLGFRLEGVSGTAGGTITLRALFFPGWNVTTVAGPGKATVEPSPDGLVTVRLPADGVYELRVWFSDTPQRMAAGAASLLSLLVLILLSRRAARLALPATAT